VRLAGAGLAALLALGVLRSAPRQLVWKDNATLFASAVADEPLSYKARHAHGGMLFSTGKRAEGEHHLRIAMRLMARDADVRVDLARTYREAGLCGPALPLYEEAIAIDPRRPDARVGLVACLLREARFDEARAQAARGLAIGDQRPAFRTLLSIADSAIAARTP
jgi:tetratricopeptide (TPR) repeat protein